MQIAGGKPRDEGNVLIVMLTLDRVFGRKVFEAHADALVPLGEVFAKAILDLRIAFRNGLKS